MTEPENGAKQATILLVDDDRELASVLGEFLEHEGHRVVSAHTGRDARAALRTRPFTLLLVDLRLPDVEGVELMQEALRLPNPPEVVIITGNATVESAVAAVEAGAAGYVVKPFAFSHLGTLVARVVERRGLARENARLGAELADRLAEAESMLAISSAIGSTLDLQEAFRRICRALVRLTSADTAAAYLHDPARDLLVPTAAYHVPKELLEVLARSSIPLREQGFHLPVWESRRAVHSDDVGRDPRFTHDMFRAIPHQSGLLLPLVLDDDVAGAFYLVWWRERRRFAERELATLEQVSGQVALLIRNARLYAQADRDRRRLDTLLEVSRKLSALHDTEGILSLIVEEATRLIGADGAWIRLVLGEELVLAARSDSAAAMMMARPKIRIGESLSGTVVATGKPVAVEDLAADERVDAAHKRTALEHGYHGFLSVPLRAHDRTTGVLNVFTRERRRFLPEEISLLSGFADQASLAIEKGWLLREAEQGRQTFARLYKVAIAMQASLDPGDRVQAFVRGVHEVVGFDRVNVLLATPDGADLELVTALGEGETPPPARVPLSPAAGPYYQAFQSRLPLAVLSDEDLADVPSLDPAFRAHPFFRTRRFLVVPLVAGERVIGVVSADNKTSRRPISPRSIEPFTLLCQELAMALEESRLYAETRAREQETAKLYDITRQLAASLDLDRVIDLITAQTLELLGCDASGIYTYDEARGGLTFLRGLHLHLDPELTRGLVLKPGEGVAGRAFQEARPVWTRDRLADSSLRYTPAADELIRTKAPRAYLAVPIASRGQVHGVLVDYYFAPHDFSPKEVQLLSTLADHAAIALENARLYAETRAREEEATRLYSGLTLLNQASRALYRTLDVEAMLKGALEELARAFGAGSVLVNLVNDDGTTTRSIGHWLSEAHGRDAARYRKGGITGQLRATRAPLLLRSVAERPDIVNPAHSMHGVRSLSAFPIVGQHDRMLGVLLLYYTTPQSFPESEVQLLGAYAGQLATALENARLYEDAETQRTRLRLIFDSTSDGIVLLGRDGRVEAANHRAGELLAFDPATVVGRGVAALLAGALGAGDHARAVAVLRVLVQDPEQGGQGDLEITRPARRVLHWVGRPTKNAVGATIGLTLTFQDVTEEREVSQMKSDFVSFVTHQLRTPLAGIKWLLELTAQEVGVPETVRSYVQDAREANERLITLVNDLLNVSRLESGKLIIVAQPTDLGALTRSVIEEVGTLVREKRHALTLDAGAAVPPVMAEPQLLRQVVLNLVSNAIKYTPAGGRIGIRMSRDAGSVRWQIQDTGIGIPADGRRRLFEKFYRAENVRTVETEGTGLGLYLVRLIVELLDGRIWCESEEGKGSTFVVTLPAAE